MGHATSYFHHSFLDAAFDHGSNDQLRPRPAVSFTFSRNARLILLGYGAQPSVHTNTARSACPHLRTCCISRSASWVSRVGLTTPASHKRVETITANPIHTIILRPLTRISSACTCIRSS